MADEKEPRAITYKQVQSAVGKEGSLAAWEKIGEITGAGRVSTGIDHDGSIDLTDADDADIKRIDELLAEGKAAKAERAKSAGKAKPQSEVNK